MRDLHAERKAAISAARAITESCKAQGNRDLTPAEQTTIQGYLDTVSELDKAIKGRATVQSVMGLADSETDFDGGGVFTPEAKAGLTHALKTRTAYRTEVDAKALIGVTGLLPPAGQGIVPGLQPGNVFALANLFANEPASGPVVRFYEMGAGTAAIVAEGQPKPDSGVAAVPRDATLVKVACLSTISTELQDDAPAVVAQIATELSAAVTSAENDHVLAAWAAASGLLTNTANPDTLLDVIATEIAVITAGTGVVPTAVVMPPVLLAGLRQLRGTTNDSYVFDPLSSSPASVHGVPLISTAAGEADEVWVVSSRACTMFRRGPITVEVGLDGTNFSTNTATMIAEERVVCAVQRATMISQITVGPAGG